MESQISPSNFREPTIPLPLVGKLGSNSASTADSSGIVTRGVGRCLGKYFPHLLKNNFNRILLVDEDPEIHVEFDKILASSGYLVQHAISEIDAIQLIKENPPDFLIINWKKSTTCSMPFYESLRRGFLDRYLYIIAMVADEEVRDKVQVSASGADAFFAKPIASGELLSMLQSGMRIIEQQLRSKELSMHDPLTGLLNRRTFTEMIAQEWTRAQRHNEAISCAMVDIDFFKNVNDVFGHIQGDRALCRIGEILNRVGRRSDIICRYGEDEFCVWMANTDMQGSLAGAERFRKTVEGEKHFFEESDSFPNVSIGVSTKTDDMANVDALIAKADQALLWAKKNGRNIVASYDAGHAEVVRYREKHADHCKGH
jgi:diguanylate cyclase (GGDEF)-like protein